MTKPKRGSTRSVRQVNGEYVVVHTPELCRCGGPVRHYSPATIRRPDRFEVQSAVERTNVTTLPEIDRCHRCGSQDPYA